MEGRQYQENMRGKRYAPHGATINPVGSCRAVLKLGKRRSRCGERSGRHLRWNPALAPKKGPDLGAAAGRKGTPGGWWAPEMTAEVSEILATSPCPSSKQLVNA